MLQSVRKQAWKLIFLQIAVIFIVSIVWWYWRSWYMALAALLGGVTVVIANVYFLYNLFSNKDRSPIQVVKAFYIGELMKLLISFVLLLLIFKLLGVKLIPLLSGFIAAYLAIWLTPFFVKI